LIHHRLNRRARVSANSIRELLRDVHGCKSARWGGQRAPACTFQVRSGTRTGCRAQRWLLIRVLNMRRIGEADDHLPVKEPDCTAFRIMVFSTLCVFAKLVFDFEKIRERRTGISTLDLHCID
jgi:hypothetical protein